MYERTAILITAYQTTDFQKIMLKACIKSIQEFMKNAHIFILNDNHNSAIEIYDDPLIKSETTKFAHCGEVNAYVWACEHRGEFDTFIFLHDSTIVLKTIPLELPYHFRPLWYTSKYVSDNLKGKDVESFIEKFSVKGESCKDIYQKLLQNRGSIVFGGMAIFDTVFLNFLAEKTNFMELAHTLNTRFLRCFFERVLYIVYCKFQDGTHFNLSALCGDIFNHREAFQRSKLIRPELANNPYVLKVWQGR